jgi:hypothetical protein
MRWQFAWGSRNAANCFDDETLDSLHWHRERAT